MKEEIWKEIPHTEKAYDASSLGKIRSFQRRLVLPNKKGSCIVVDRNKDPKILTLTLGINKYLKTEIKYKGKARTTSVHVLILEAFVGPRPNRYYDAAHLNGIRTDNRINNLKWCTRKENQSHRKIHGTHSRGQNDWRSKITDAQRLEIKERVMAGESPTALSKQFGISRALIRDTYKLKWLKPRNKQIIKYFKENLLNGKISFFRNK